MYLNNIGTCPIINVIKAKNVCLIHAFSTIKSMISRFGSLKVTFVQSPAKHLIS